MMPSDYLKQSVWTLIILSLSVTGCEEDPTEDDAGVNPAVLSGGMEIAQSSRVTGEFPASSPESGAPSIKDEEDTLYLIAGTYTHIYVDVLSGEVEGFNVMVSGAKDYLKVTGNSVFTEYAPSGTQGFEITLDANISAGPATLLYSAYDTENRVSNIVELPVIISGMPGKDSEFIFGKWSTIREIWGTGPGTETIEIGVAKEIEFTSMIDCTSEPDKPITWIQVTRYDYKHYTFSSDGTLILEVDDFYQTLDSPASQASCSLEYSINDQIDFYDGIWSYHSDTKRLILRYKMRDVANVTRREYRTTITDGVLHLQDIGYSVPNKHLLEKV